MNYERDKLRNARVAHNRYKGENIVTEALSDGALFSVTAPVADVFDKPNGSLQRQLLHGDAVLVIEHHEGFAFGEAVDGDYVGYIAESDLGVICDTSHFVKTFGGHVYPEANIKTKPLYYLPFGAGVHGSYDAGDFVELNDGGFIPKQQVAKYRVLEEDYVATALRFLGTPYLWGGDSNLGLDCSGLVHMAMRAAYRMCPRDSDQQERFFDTIDQDEDVQRGDLVFWKGHVGIMADAEHIVHANGHHMAVTVEKLDEVSARIKEAEGKDISSIARP